VLADLLVMACTGASIAFFAHRTLPNKQADGSSLATLDIFAAIAVLVGTIALQFMHQILARHVGQAATGHRTRPPASHHRASSQPAQPGKPLTGTSRRRAHVRFSGRS
jgi:ABC-type phosphate transport system permease subunit